MIIFVYGTLKRGYSNHHFLEKLKAQFLRESLTKEMYCLAVNFAPFAIKECKKELKGKIVIEIYSIDKNKISLLDEFEDAPRFYVRQLIKDINNQKGWLYFLPKERLSNRAHFLSPKKGIICF
ncbi:gamma-glutamylcyclotransferase family protein [Hippea maritima]|uniref:Gamma-glutamylcyclotransferase family protein n=1 Tax=Hippea maritima (strain ATCC 700847 / DSM 10411 / MH2) TaxID=760142 RepID=F2LVD9_HIPMA|nr:gamma-glutamylcyclotransferase family protein [Hippea maritima]AEA33723.1 AIG2 family protein [Hippea maritima DSM 10411]